MSHVCTKGIAQWFCDACRDEDIAERAAIMEFDGGMPRDDAERAARERWKINKRRWFARGAV